MIKILTLASLLVLACNVLAADKPISTKPMTTSSKKTAANSPAADAVTFDPNAASLNRGFGSDCSVAVNCSSGRQIWCRNSGVPAGYFSVCVRTMGNVGLVACAVDDNNGTITSYGSDSCP